jgi:hypothetical protein
MLGGSMQTGQPFNCTHVGAKLTWKDAPVIECAYLVLIGSRDHVTTYSLDVAAAK